jgi:hypothetical protein
MKRPFTYTTGEPIFKGDVVKIGQLDAVVVGVVTEDSPEWSDYGGVALEGPAFGAMRMEHINEDLVLVHRKSE